jgi:hypothetical protein
VLLLGSGSSYSGRLCLSLSLGLGLSLSLCLRLSLGLGVLLSYMVGWMLVMSLRPLPRELLLVGEDMLHGGLDGQPWQVLSKVCLVEVLRRVEEDAVVGRAREVD